MWTLVGVIATIQYDLVQLIDDVAHSWRVSLFFIMFLIIILMN